jgi:hypothetical protein
MRLILVASVASFVCLAACSSTTPDSGTSGGASSSSGASGSSSGASGGSSGGSNATVNGQPADQFYAQFQIPADLGWSGAPDTWNATSPGANTGLHVTVKNYSQDVGVAASLAKTLLYYASGSGNAQAKSVGEQLLTALSANTDPLLTAMVARGRRPSDRSN